MRGLKNNIREDKMKKIICIYLVIISSLFIGLNPTQQSVARVNISLPNPINTTSSLTPFAPIDINSDLDFSAFNGSGSVLDPYRIENLNITSASSVCIDIQNVDVYFVIQNCFLMTENLNGAIYISEVSDGKCQILNNWFVSSPHAIHISDTAYNQITGNNFTHIAFQNILLYNASLTSITSNTFISGGTGGAGINCDDCKSVIIVNNDFDNLIGISIHSNVYGLIIHDNSFTHKAISIPAGPDFAEVASHIIYDNTINSRLLGYFVNQTNLNLHSPEYAQLNFINCSNVLAENQVLDPNCDLEIHFCHKLTVSKSRGETDLHITIRHSSEITLSGNKAEIWSAYSENLIISSNTVDGYFNGMYLFDCVECIIYNNTIKNNDQFGLWVYDTHNCYIQDNKFLSNTYGLCFAHHSENATVIQNTFTSNYDSGRAISSARNISFLENVFQQNTLCLDLYDCSYSKIDHNIFYQNTEGLRLEFADYNNITYNLFQENTNYGVNILANSEWNRIHHNSFFDNNQGGSAQAYDESDNNTWYDEITLQGNYWNDYSGSGDYLIAGPSLAVDIYPLISPIIPRIPEFSPLSLFLLFLMVPVVVIRKRKKH